MSKPKLFNGWPEDPMDLYCDAFVMSNGQVLVKQLKFNDREVLRCAITINPNSMHDAYFSQDTVKKDIKKYYAKELLKEKNK